MSLRENTPKSLLAPPLLPLEIIVRAYDPRGIEVIVVARPLRPGTPPEIETPGRPLFPAIAGTAVPAPDPGCGPTLDGDSVLAGPVCPSPTSLLVPISFSTRGRGKFSPAFKASGNASLPPAAPDAVRATAESPDGPTTNREDSSPSGITGRNSGGTLTALMTTAAFGVGIAGRTDAANRGELDWEAVSAFGGAAGSAEATANFGASTVRG